MRVLVQASKDPSEWFDKVDKDNLRKSIALVKGKFILLTGSTHNSELFKSLEGFPDDECRELAVSFIENAPKGVLRAIDSDFCVATAENSIVTFDTIQPELDNLFELRSRGAAAGENVKDFFERTFLVLAKTATRVEIYDRYVGSIFLDKYVWPITELLKISNLEVVFFTGLEINDRETNSDFEERTSQLEQNLELLINKTRGSKNDESITRLVSLKIPRGHLHHRYAVFHFQGQPSLALSLLKGLKEFTYDAFKEATVLSVIDDSNLVLTIRQQWNSYVKSEQSRSAGWSGRTRI